MCLAHMLTMSSKVCEKQKALIYVTLAMLLQRYYFSVRAHALADQDPTPPTEKQKVNGHRDSNQVPD
jgi:hypothetical protein